MTLGAIVGAWFSWASYPPRTNTEPEDNCTSPGCNKQTSQNVSGETEHWPTWPKMAALSHLVLSPSLDPTASSTPEKLTRESCREDPEAHNRCEGHSREVRTDCTTDQLPIVSALSIGLGECWRETNITSTFYFQGKVSGI